MPARRRVAKIRRRLAGQRGFTLAEVLLAAVIMVTATSATFATLRTTQRTTLASQRSLEATRLAASALDEMKSYKYSELGMSANMSGSANPPQTPTTDLPRLTPATGTASTMKIFLLRGTFDTALTSNEDIVQPSNGGATDDGSTAGPAGKISVAPKDVTVAGSSGTGTRFRIYKYVTWVDERCFGVGEADQCAGTHNIKRITVAVEPRTLAGGVFTVSSSDPAPRRPTWMSAFALDLGAGGDSGTSCGGVACGTLSQGNTSQDFYLYDSMCSGSHITRPALSGDHVVHQTAAAGLWTSKTVSACRNTVNPGGAAATPPCFPAGFTSTGICRPDLMWTTGPPAASSEGDNASVVPAYRYSTDLKLSNSPLQYGYGPAGVPLRMTAGCHTNYAISASTPPTMDTSLTTRTAAMVHAWSTNAFELDDFMGDKATPTKFPQTGFLVAGRIALRLYVSQYGANPNQAIGKLCVTLIDRNEASGTTDPTGDDKILYQFTCTLPRWPQGRPQFFGQTGAGYASDKRGGQPLRARKECRFNPKGGMAGTNGAGSIAWPAGGHRVLNGRRLVVVMSATTDAPSGSQNSLIIHYDYPNQASMISLATSQNSTIAPGE